MRVLITGATGFIGHELIKRVEQGVVVTRNVAHARESLPGAEVHAWDPMSEPLPASALEGVETIFHLAGEPVAEGRWTAAKKQRIRDSRIIGTRNLVAGLRQAQSHPPVLISASAVGFYGDRGDEVLDENSSAGGDFLAEVCWGWERESHAARELGVRVVNPRIGVVLGRGGGALTKMLTIFKLGVGGRLASGHQWMPWVHLSDVVGMMLHAAKNVHVEGPMNATAPNPVTNREFTAALAKALHRPAIVPAPAFGLKLALGEVADVLLSSQRALPKVAEKTGYHFQFPQLDDALKVSVG